MHVVALGAVLTAHVLAHDDVTGGDRGVEHLRHDGREVRTREARDAVRGVVWRARQEHGRVRCALRDQDEGLELHAVPHRDHLLALDEVELVRLRREGRRARLRGCDSPPDPEREDLGGENARWRASGVRLLRKQAPKTGPGGPVASMHVDISLRGSMSGAQPFDPQSGRTDE